jgi:spermidine dehydrogenase
MVKRQDRNLGMGRPIDRRDFLQGVSIGAAVTAATILSPELSAAAEAERLAQDEPGYYPPTRLGMRGSHPGSFEAAHAVRDGDFWRQTNLLEDVDEQYDLVIVGGGISGLSAAYFYKSIKPKARILILENHDDFGGHAKRNEFHIAGRVELLNGGTFAIESPTPYGPVAAGLLETLGVDPKALSKTCDDTAIYDLLGLRPAVFFDKETFGIDKLVVRSARPDTTPGALQAFLQETPLSEAVRRDILRIEEGTEDYLAGLTSDQKKDRLSRLSYQDYLLNLVKADPGVIPFYAHRTDDLWGCGIDAVSAIDCWGVDFAGFKGLNLSPGPTPRMGYTPAGYAATGGSSTFHFPDGNASIARLLVRSLIPAVMPGHSATDVVSAKADYGELDRSGAPVRIRLNSLVVRARNVETAKGMSGVEVAYTPAASGTKVFRLRARDCILASWNMMVPYLCPELPNAQKDALHQLIKTPLVYTSVALRNWTAFQRLGIRSVDAPGSYYSSFRLNEPVNIGDYHSPRSPNEPILVHMLRTPAKPGLPEREQHKAGRLELLTTPFETFERNVRDQLGRTLGQGGFDPAHDIVGIAVNRWPHGYAPEYNALVDGETTSDRTPNLVGRARFGRIAIANSDSGMAAYTDVAIEQAYRAVHELVDNRI